jgi:hypothetical protein
MACLTDVFYDEVDAMKEYPGRVCRGFVSEGVIPMSEAESAWLLSVTERRLRRFGGGPALDRWRKVKDSRRQLAGLVIIRSDGGANQPPPTGIRMIDFWCGQYSRLYADCASDYGHFS